ncbi:nucleotidyltransferase domain-containing protein [Candidatus Babeliales bacterium]|nr:nucleotidyltransferase domain-containing protein [Candidatus Babeliales bacterium]
MAPATETYQEKLLEIINKHIPGCSVYLFGSRARNTHREGADIDLAIDCEKKIDISMLFKIASDIEDSNVPVFVDLVDLQDASPDLKNEIMNDRILWQK